MVSTGEPERKRRHVNNLSPVTPMAKKQPLPHTSEDKKLDTAVLQYQNQKLIQKLEAQKIEYSVLQNKFSRLRDIQQPHKSILEVISHSWGQLIRDLETSSNDTRDSRAMEAMGSTSFRVGGGSCLDEAFLGRLMEAGARDCSCTSNGPDQMGQYSAHDSDDILHDIVCAINYLWQLETELLASALKNLSEAGACRKESHHLESEVKNLRARLSVLHLSHRSLAGELQNCRDVSAKNKVHIKHINEELNRENAELQESKHELETLKLEKDAGKMAFFPVLNLGSNQVVVDGVGDKQKDLQEMESAHKDLLDQSSSCLLELQALHDERINTLQELSSLQNLQKSVDSIWSSESYVFIRDNLEKSKLEVSKYQLLLQKHQIEKDTLLWKERELKLKDDINEVLLRYSNLITTQTIDLEIDIKKQMNEKNIMESDLKEALKEPRRKHVLGEFKALVSQFPEKMGNMQREMSNYKNDASDLHHLRADRQSVSTVLGYKEKECIKLSARYDSQVTEKEKLLHVVKNLEESCMELMLILEMYRRESLDSRSKLAARDLEYRAWAEVHSLKSSLDEQSLELRVKAANEAEAISQHKLATAETEIADLMQKLDTSVSFRESCQLSDVLKSKNEEITAYLSEIETIGQAYDEIQIENQHLLQQITERDDYNINLVLDGLRAKQLQNSRLMDKQKMEKGVQQANMMLDTWAVSSAKIEDQLKICSDRIDKLADIKKQNVSSFDQAQRNVEDAKSSCSQSKVVLRQIQRDNETIQSHLLDVEIDLERESFGRRRLEEELVLLRRKVSCIQVQTESSSVVQKLQQELDEYRELLKCGICDERSKEVVITKCYHLFCNACVQRIIESRHRKCPDCGTGFGANDVKPVYI